MGGAHEPQPWFGQQAIDAFYGEPSARAQCHRKLADRLALGLPAVVDLHHSYLIPMIAEIDAGAEFVWLLRDPRTCIASLLAGGAWTRMNNDSATLWRPRDGWPVGETRLGKAIAYWIAVNQIILRDLQACGRPWEQRLTEQLTAHENRYPGSAAWQYTPAEAALVMEGCGTFMTYFYACQSYPSPAGLAHL